MRLRQLGNSGLHVGRLALGTMTWGRVTDEVDARDQLRLFAAAGGNLIDTADVYGDGEAERMLGRILVEESLIDSVMIATKAGSRPGTQRRFDASRKHLLDSLNGSLRRLGVDCVDVWQLHAWDSLTPVAETLAAAEQAVADGKARYVGICNYSGWQAATVASLTNASPAGPFIVSAQAEYSLLQRGVEREVVPAAAAHGLGILSWSPTGRGVLTGKYRNSTPADSRAADPHFSSFVAPYLEPESHRIVDAVLTAADGLDVTAGQVALSWIRDRPGVSAAVVGARNTSQLATALATEDLELPGAVAAALEEVSRPAMGYPEAGWNQRPAPLR